MYALSFRRLLAPLFCLTLICCSEPQAALPESDTNFFQKAELEEDRGRFREAVALYRQAGEHFEKNAHNSLQEVDWQKVVTCLNRMGWHLSVSLGDHHQARLQLERAIEIGESYLGSEASATLRGYHNLAVVAYYQGNLDEALQLNTKLLALRRQRYGEVHAEVAATLNNLGMVYLARSDLDRSLRHYQHALAIKITLHGPHHASLASTHLNLGRIYTLLGDHDQAVSALQACYDLRTTHLQPGHPQIGAAAYVLGMALTEAGRYQHAHELLQEASRVQVAAYGEGHPHWAHTLWELGKLETLLGKEELGLQTLDRAQRILSAHYGAKDYHLAESHNHLAWHHWREQRWDTALDHMARALEALDYQPGVVNPSGNFGDEALIRCLQGRATILCSKYRMTGDSSLLENALAAIDDACEAMVRRRLDVLSQNSKLALNARFQNILTLGVHGALELHRHGHGDIYLDRAFSFAEASKMATLRDALTESRARHFAGIPEVVLARERTQIKRVHQLSTRLAGETEGHDKPAEELMPELLAAYDERDTFIAGLKADYPRYYQLKYAELERTVTPLPEWVKDDETALIKLPHWQRPADHFLNHQKGCTGTSSKRKWSCS